MSTGKPAPGLISAELCLKFFDVHKLIAISLEGRNSDCLTAFLRMIILGRSTIFIWRSPYFRVISLTFQLIVTFKHYMRIDGFKPTNNAAIIDIYSYSIKSLIKVKLKIKVLEQ